MQNQQNQEYQDLQERKLQGLHYFLCTRDFNTHFQEDVESVNVNIEEDVQKNGEETKENAEQKQLDMADLNKESMGDMQMQGIIQKILKGEQNNENQIQPSKAQKQLATIPQIFNDGEDYFQTFEGHILNEAKSQIIKAIVTDSNPPEKVKLIGVEKIKGSPVYPLGQTFWKFRVNRIQSQNNTNIYAQHDFCILSQNDPTGKDVGEHILGILEKSEGEQIILKVIYSEQEQNHRIKQSWYLQKLCRIVTIEREYEALVSFEESSMKDFLINPQKLLEKQKELEYFYIPEKLETKLYQNYNESQISAIKQTLKKKGITLIQGPPGTGKTTTVIGTVSVLMNSLNKVNVQEQFQSVKSGIKVENGQINQKLVMPWMLSGYTDWRDSVFEDSLGIADLVQGEEIQLKFVKPKEFHKVAGKLVNKINTEDHKPPEKILLCGPSNASIDEIIRKMLEKKLLDSDGTLYDPSNVLVRIGENYDPVLQHFSLEYQASQLMQEKNMKEEDKLEAKKIILKRAKLICGTLSAAGSYILQQLNLDIDTVIIDEAAQAVEPSILVPLQYKCKRLILIGDQKQLPATIFSKVCEKFNYSQSLFERLEKIGYPIHMLKVQYRMHPNISHFISSTFYHNNLQDYEKIVDLIGKPKIYEVQGFKPLMFFHVSGAEKFVKSSFQNEEEATFIAYLYKELQKSIGKDVNVHDYCGVITPYSRQVKEIRRKIKVIENLEKCPLEVNSVDGYQGREKNMIIFSTVRASQIALEQTGQEDKIVKNNRKKIGFLNDARRMNVSLSRAKACLIVIGDLNQLRHHQKWKHLMDIAVEQDSCYQVKGKAQNFLSKFSKNPETFKIKNLEDIVDVRENKKIKNQKKLDKQQAEQNIYDQINKQAELMNKKKEENIEIAIETE